MKNRWYRLLELALFCMGVNVLSRLIFEPGPENIVDFIGGTGAGMCLLAFIGLLFPWKARKHDRDEDSGRLASESKRPYLLVFAGLFWVFFIFWLIYR
jgi:hypothetical protein